MATLTDEKIKEYVTEGGRYCLYCGGTNLCVLDVNVTGYVATQPVLCDDCGATWLDKYMLVGIEEDEGK